MGQLALSLACFSSLPWFPGGSLLLHLGREILVLPGPIAPSQVSWWGCRRHHPGPCLSPCALLTPRMGVQRAAAAMVWLSCPLGCSAFCSFFPVSWIKKRKKCWLTLLDAFLLALKQHNAVKFCNLFGCFFLFKYWCKMILLFKIVSSLNNFSFNSKSAGNRARKLHLNSF